MQQSEPSAPRRKRRALFRESGRVSSCSSSKNSRLGLNMKERIFQDTMKNTVSGLIIVDGKLEDCYILIEKAYIGHISQALDAGARNIIL